MMNQAHLHLLFNHLPILGVFFGLLVLAGGFFLKNNSVKRTALGIFVLSGVFAIPAYLTGEGAEEVVEGIAGVSENLIERHEELANIFLSLAGALGLIAVATLYADLKWRKFAPVLYALTFAVATGAMVFAQQAGSSGGEIRHSEIRTGSAAASLESGSNVGKAEENDD